MPDPTPLDTLTVEHFEKRTDQAFRLVLDDGALELTLREAVAVGEAREGARQGFSLVFVGPREPLLPQSTYRLVHPDMGQLALFLVPIGQDNDGTRYEAVFS